MKMRLRTAANRRGFTLIELVVVLLVLAGLAGMLVPVLQNMVTKTHGATGGANMNEVAKAIQMFEAQTMGRHPNNYDSLIAGTEIVAGSHDLELAALTAAEADALVKIGIRNLYDHDADSPNKTFETYGSTQTPRPVAEGAEVATMVTSSEAFETLGLQPTADDGSAIKYVAFGIGAANTAVGKTMVAAPVHFPESGENPVNEYSRFIAIYRLPATGPARLATIAAFHHDHLSGLGNHLNEFYGTQEPVEHLEEEVE